MFDGGVGKVAGLLLAAGGGSRYGTPKALVVSDGEAWVARGSRVLSEAGCEPLVVVLGAAADEAAPLVPHTTDIVMNPDWGTGMGSSLRAGLQRCLTLPVQVQAVVVLLVDLPGINAEVISEFVSRTRPPLAQALQQATFDGVVGHPVLLGRDHWAAVADSSTGDTGARSYLVKHDAVRLEMGHLADGSDRDTPTGTPSS